MVNFSRGIGLMIFLIPLLVTLGSCGGGSPEMGPFLYITNGFHGTVSAIDTSTNQPLSPIMAPNSICHEGSLFCPSAVAVSPDGSHAYVSSQNSVNPGSVFVIDTESNKPLSGALYAVGVAPEGLAVTQDGKVYVANSGDGTVSVIDTAGNSVSQINVNGHPVGVAVAATPKGVTKVYVTGDSVSVIDTSNNGVVATLPVNGISQGVAVSPDQKRVYLATENCNKSVQCWGSLSAFDTISDLPVPGFPISLGTISPSGFTSGPYWIAITPDGSRIYASTYMGVAVFETALKVPILTAMIPIPDPSPSGIAVTPDGKRVYVAAGGKVFIIDTTTNQSAGTPILVGDSPALLAIVPTAREPDSLGILKQPRT
jgi:YVTN family beta-propeller protein